MCMPHAQEEAGDLVRIRAVAVMEMEMAACGTLRRISSAQMANGT